MSTFILRFPGDVGPGATRVAVKDLIDIAGFPTTCGSKVVAAAAKPAESDAACLAGLRAAEASGAAVIVGKANLHELAFGVSGINPWYGTPVNPLDASRVPGGSSSGSAVAVATREADVAFGSDTGGSIRIPAACCGVVGLKTTRGRIPLGGVEPLAPSLDTVGPLGATVAAAGTGMALLEPGFTWAGRSPAARIGRFRPTAERWVDKAVDRALSEWSSAGGGEVVDIELPGWKAANEAFTIVLMSEAWSVHRLLWEQSAGDLSPDVAERLEMGSMLDRSEVAAAWELARRWAGELTALLASVDLIALPVLAATPPLLDDPARMLSIRLTGPFNLAGLPALALPVAGEEGGLPASLQLVGPAGSEELIMATAEAVEAVGGRA